MDDLPEFNVSYKPQKISPKFDSTVRNLLHKKIRDSYLHPQFISDVIKPMNIEALMDQEVINLSGGELQRVALTLCMGQARGASTPTTPQTLVHKNEHATDIGSDRRLFGRRVLCCAWNALT